MPTEERTTKGTERCATHPSRNTVGICDVCGRPLCVECAVPVRGRVTLKLHGMGAPRGSEKSLSIADVDEWPMLDSRTDRSRDGALSIRNNSIELAIDGHDFRLVEVTWG